jgi:hypothetical protein
VIAHDGQLGAVLIEAIEPGTPLDVCLSDPDVETVGDLLRSLYETGVADRSYPTLGQRVSYLFGASAKLYELHPEVTELVPMGLYERGRRLASRLAAHDSPSVLLHGDLTPANVLDGGDERGLVAIDPAPCVGDSAFDAVDLVLWRVNDLETIETRISQLAVAAGCDGERLLAWCTAFAGMGALALATQHDPAAVSGPTAILDRPGASLPPGLHLLSSVCPSRRKRSLRLSAPLGASSQRRFEPCGVRCGRASPRQSSTTLAPGSFVGSALGPVRNSTTAFPA